MPTLVQRQLNAAKKIIAQDLDCYKVDCKNCPFARHFDDRGWLCTDNAFYNSSDDHSEVERKKGHLAAFQRFIDEHEKPQAQEESSVDTDQTKAMMEVWEQEDCLGSGVDCTECPLVDKCGDDFAGDPSMSKRLAAEWLAEHVEQPEQSNVDHPAHYGGDTPYEAIKVIEAYGWGKSFCMGNVLKYLLRSGKKGNEKEDIKKAIWYLNRYLEKLDE